MFRIVLVTVFPLLTTPLFAQNAGFQDYRTGQYKILHEATGNTLIERTETTQIELHARSNLKLDVNWVGCCKFTLKLIEVLNNPNDIRVPKDAVFTVEITEIKEDSYIQKTTSNLSEMVIITEAVRLK